MKPKLTFQQIIDKHVTKKSAPGPFNMNWIELKKQKPEHRQLCLISAKSADPESPFRHISFYHDNTDEAFPHRWPNIVSQWSNHITHWMPFPKTPFKKRAVRKKK